MRLQRTPETVAGKGMGLKRHRIGEWEFDPASGELRSGAECRRLEPRAARTLELLCEAEGEVVPQDRLIAEVWNGRNLSDNSISVVGSSSSTASARISVGRTT